MRCIQQCPNLPLKAFKEAMSENFEKNKNKFKYSLNDVQVCKPIHVCHHTWHQLGMCMTIFNSYITTLMLAGTQTDDSIPSRVEILEETKGTTGTQNQSLWTTARLTTRLSQPQWGMLFVIAGAGSKFNDKIW